MVVLTVRAGPDRFFGLGMDRLPVQFIDISIEAITGAIYDLTVSTYETILSIKLKLQRLEGEKNLICVRKP